MSRVRLERAVAVGERVEPPAEQAHHLVHVRRLSAGMEVEILDGEARAWRGTLVSTEPARLEVIAPAERTPARPEAALEVWVPLLKGGRTDDLVRQLTELGAVRIVPLVTARSVARPDARRASKRLSRWRHIAEEATRQCGREDLPEVAPVQGLPESGPPGVFLWEEADEPARDALGDAVDDGRLRVLVGPEGGLASAEAEALAAAGWRAASLGPRVLRAETAVVAAAVLGLHALGEGGY